MILRVVAFALLAVLVASSRAQSSDTELLEVARATFKPVPAGVPELKGNAATPARVDLGKMLFFEPRLSKSGVISCFTCHNLAMGGDDNLPISIGHSWQRGPRNSPTVLNAVFNAAQFWDGRAKDLRTQARSPIQASVEMASEPETVVATLESIPEYMRRFRAAFPDEEQPVSFDNVALALEAYEATLTTPDSRFDQLLRGEEARFTERETKGLRLFIGKGCASCHNGMNLGGQAYFPFGVVKTPDARARPPGDRGRYEVTKTETDDYVFRAAPLRNVALTAPYFHSGGVWSLREAVAIMGSSQLGAALNEAEIDAITAFLETLTGRQPVVQLPQLPVESATTPRPAPYSAP